MKCLRNANGIKVGDKYRYRSRGLYVDGMWINRGAEYDAEVIEVTKYLVVLRIMIDQLTMPGYVSTMGKPRPYNWSIRKVDIGRNERLMVADDDE